MAKRLCTEMDIVVWLQVKKISSYIQTFFHLEDNLLPVSSCGAGIGNGKKFWINLKMGWRWDCQGWKQTEKAGWTHDHLRGPSSLPHAKPILTHSSGVTKSICWHSGKWTLPSGGRLFVFFHLDLHLVHSWKRGLAHINWSFHLTNSVALNRPFQPWVNWDST